jgi:membrane dipeptidase
MNRFDTKHVFFGTALMLLFVPRTGAQGLDAGAKTVASGLQAKIDELMKGVDPRTPEDRAKDVEVRQRYKDAIVIDMCVPGSPFAYVKNDAASFDALADLSKDTGFTSVSYTAAVDEELNPMTVIDWIAKGTTHWKSQPDKYLMVETVDDIYRAKKEGKLAVMFNFQGSNPLGGNLNMVSVYYRLGVRQMNFAYNVRNFMSDGGGAVKDRDGGLSLAGKRLVAVMNDVGMVVDCTHSSNRAALDAAEVSTKPIVLSHSNPLGAYALPRNSPDDVVKAVAKTGGVIATNGLGGFLNKEGNASPTDIARHVNYVKELVGAEHTAFGSDYVHNYAEALSFVLTNPESYPPELGYGSPTQMAVPGDIWGVVRVLEAKHNWSPKEIRGFLGENALRVFKANWRSSK